MTDDKSNISQPGTLLKFPDYKYIDTALGGADRRNNIIHYTELDARLLTCKGLTDCYATYWLYPDELLAYYEKNDHSVKGYDGSIYSEIIPVDIDDKTDLARAHEVAKTVVLSLDIDPNVLRIYFSGSKGFHIEIPSQLFGIEPSLGLNDVVKTIVKKLLPGIPFDHANYDKMRLWRIPNTRNGKSGLYKIPLSAHELLTISIDEIKQLAEGPRPTGQFFDDALDLNPALHALYKAVAANSGKSVAGSRDQDGLEKLFVCDFIRFCHDNRASLPEPLWYAMVSNVARVKPAYADELSKGYPGYSEKETFAKIIHSLNDGGPHTCRFIKDNGFECNKECRVSSPIVLVDKEIQKTTKDDQWPDPVPFDEHSSLPYFPLDALSGIGREMVQLVSEVNQVDPALTACLYLATLSVCTAKKARVHLLTHVEPVNVYLCAVSDSGTRKSSTQSAILQALYEYQKNRKEAMSEIIREAQIAFRIKERRLERLQKEAAEEDDSAERQRIEQEASDLARDMAENPVPKSPVYLVDDITPEKLGVAMAENDERMAVIDSEGGLFEIMAGRYSKDGVGNIDLFLKAHAGDPWSCHRIGREANTMQAPALTLCLAVQPKVIEEAGKNDHFRGKGLLARFLYTLCESTVGYRERQTKSVPSSLMQRYREHVFSLMDIPFTGVDLRLTGQAQSLWDEFYNDIEKEMRPEGSLYYLRDWGSKLPGAVARIAGLLHLAEHGGEGLSLPLSVNSVRASCVIGAYFKEHAIAVFGLMQEDRKIKLARQIRDYIGRVKPEIFTGRNVLHHTSIGLMEDVEQGLKVLMDRGYIREDTADDPKDNRGPGRPKGRGFRVNPKIFENKYV